MTNAILLKRSSTQGKVPLIGDLQLGEIALNTYDGKAYFKRNNGTEGVVEIITSAGGSSSFQPLDADLTAIAGLSGTSGLLKKTAADTWTLDTTDHTAASSITSGVFSTARLGTGTADSTTYLRGDGTWQTVTSGATITDDTTTNGTRYLLFDDITSGASTSIGVSSTKLTYNPSTGTLASTKFSGNGSLLTDLDAGNVTTGYIGLARLGSGSPSATTYLKGDGTWATLDKSAVGLSNVENTALSTWAGSSNITTVGSLTSLTVTGDLTVNGTTTTLNSTTLTVDDKNIEMGSVASPTDVTANGGGITLKGTTDKTIIWDSTNTNWTSSENWNLASGKVYKINNTTIASETALGALSGASLTNLNASNLSSGTVGTARLGTGTASSTTYLKGDNTWGPAGATGGGSDQVFYLNGQTVNNDYTIPSGQNAGTFGPVTIADGKTVTISDNSTWTVV